MALYGEVLLKNWNTNNNLEFFKSVKKRPTSVLEALSNVSGKLVFQLEAKIKLGKS